MFSSIIVERDCFNEEAIMPVRIGSTELIIILVIVILLFGVGRISRIASELGSGIRAFREGLAGDEEKEVGTEETPTSPES